MNFILFIIILSVVANTKCDEHRNEIEIIKKKIHGLQLMNKNLFSKLDLMLNEIVKFNTNFNIITERLNQQDDNINKLPTKAEISQVMELNQQLYQKMDLQEKMIKKSSNDIEAYKIILKESINEISENQSILFQKSFDDMKNVNTTINKMIENQAILFQKSCKDFENVNETLNDLSEKPFNDLQEKTMEKSSSKDNENVNTSENKISENESLPFQQTSKDIQNINKTVNEMVEYPLIKPKIDFQNYNFSYSKSTEAINKMLPNQPLKEMGNWLVILRRQDGSEDFNRNWLDYKNGFGNPNGEFFIGLENLHHITTLGKSQELLVILQNIKGDTVYAKNNNFVVGSETERYAIKKLGDYEGDAGDSMLYNLYDTFSTKDKDNDVNCAADYQGGWWFNYYCHTTLLTGPYNHPPEYTTYCGIAWPTWGGSHYPIKFVEMMVRPKA